MIESEPSSHPTIEHYIPSEIPVEKYEELGLPEVMRGYGFTEGLMQQALEDYGEEDDDKHIFLALKDGKAIASLIVKVSHTPTSDDGKLFPLLQTIAPHVASTIQDTVICNVSGVVKHPDIKEKGLADSFFQEMIGLFHPTIVVGRTKNPDAIMARANSLARLGYRSWYGNTEVTPPTGPQQDPIAPIEDVRLAYVLSKAEPAGAEWDMLTDPQILRPTLEDVSKFPQYVQDAYLPTRIAQQRENQLAKDEGREPHTAILPLISISVNR